MSDITDALSKLSEAHGQYELVAAMRTVQRQVRKVRALEGKVIGRLAGSYAEAMAIRDRMKADGATPDQLNASLEGWLRDAWPFSYARPYACETCQDTGLQILLCRRGLRCNGISTRSDGPKEPAGRYRRLCALNPNSPYEHEYGIACMCEHGGRFREKPKPEASEFTDAGKTPKRSEFKRFGR